MKLILCIPFICLFFLSGFTGCKPGSGAEEYDTLYFSSDEADFSPYNSGDSIDFVHSGSLQFELIVDSVVQEISSERYYNRGRLSPAEPIIFKEHLFVYLSSLYPRIFIQIGLFPQVENYWSSSFISINDYSFYLDDIDPPLAVYEINGIEYQDVYALTREMRNPVLIQPEVVYYSQTDGILQIGMTNGETYSIQ